MDEKQEFDLNQEAEDFPFEREIKKLLEKTVRIEKRAARLKKKNLELAASLENHKELLKLRETEIKDLKKQIYISKLAEVFDRAEFKDELRREVEQLIETIDVCLRNLDS